MTNIYQNKSRAVRWVELPEGSATTMSYALQSFNLEIIEKFRIPVELIVNEEITFD